ncbi:MAG TPA: deoxyguanosinetriphosphate triphosphohydrolase [Anaerolineae bacterium]|nr:deoxyguanosinetriphosphate triphosphohydrolase [Anaerolineae bacterium]HQM13552.1 deoxyguanosinetriphosphate triphosphohydrolase [Anaerolineae bacterium]
MVRTREELERIEDLTLAPYAMRSGHSRGRVFPEEEAPYRTAFQRDRDRILHNTAFRRLEYKTQVFVIHEGDHYRTRLTHTLEVTQIGRTMARALGANEDLVEAVCLAHDLGHPAFGHAGEMTLNRLMQGHGGFDHNRQSLRIVEQLAAHYPEFHGLNLTWEVREGMVKHETEYDVADASTFEPEKQCTLEGQLANPADEIAYTAHDLDDGLRSGLLRPEQLNGLAWWEHLKVSLGWDGGHFNDMVRYRLTRRLLGLLVTDLIEATSARLEAEGCASVEDVRQCPQKMVGLSPGVAAMTRELKHFLYENLYRHPHVMRMQLKAERVITALFEAYLSEPAQLPYDVQAQLRERPLERVVCDYIAGMTDRYALQEYAKLFDPMTAV